MHADCRELSPQYRLNFKGLEKWQVSLGSSRVKSLASTLKTNRRGAQWQGDGRCLAHRVVIASRLPRERQPPGAPEFIARPLPYMAPEQTGRMNRSIDSPRDPYALGPYRCRCFLNYNLRAEPTSCTLVAVVGELEAHRATGFNENVHKRRHGFLAYPIPL